jgi:hypothetical protein
MKAAPSEFTASAVRTKFMTGPELSRMTAGFDTRADPHTRHTAGLGGLEDFLASDFCGFHDLISPIGKDLGS